jgi:hypothetical protein
MKIYQAVQKLLLGGTQTDRETGDLISLLSFLESMLKCIIVDINLFSTQATAVKDF